MNSIYERMNKIDDGKSLNEGWNVKTPISESKRSVSRVALNRANNLKALNRKNTRSKSMREDYTDYYPSANDWAKSIVNAENRVISNMTRELSDVKNVPVACEYSSWNSPDFVKRMLNGETFTFTAANTNEMSKLVVNKIATAYEKWLKSPQIVARSQRAMSHEEFNEAQDWYNDTGYADDDNWPDNLSNNDPDYLERVNSWWEDNRWDYVDEDEYNDEDTYHPDIAEVVHDHIGWAKEELGKASIEEYVQWFVDLSSEAFVTYTSEEIKELRNILKGYLDINESKRSVSRASALRRMKNEQRKARSKKKVFSRS